MTDLISPIRERLHGMTQAERRRVADAAGLPFATVQKIALGETPDPRISTWAALANVFGVVCAVPRDPLK